MRRVAVLFASLALLAGTGCGVDCEELCRKIERCRGGTCNNTRCEDNCELQRQYGQSLRFEDQAACTMDAQCDQLENNACFYQTFQLASWCL